MRHPPSRLLRAALLGATMLAGYSLPALPDADGDSASTTQLPLPSGQYIYPTAASGSTFQDLNPNLPDHPNYRAGQAMKTAVSPDGKTLLVMTSGYNNQNYSQAGASNYGQFEPSASNEYVFVYDITGNNKTNPMVKQIIQVPDTFEGLTFSPDGSKFYVSGGSDDQVYVYANAPGAGWSVAATIPLGHTAGVGFAQAPSVGGLATSVSGKTLVAVNTYNDSISVIDATTNTVKFEYDLRPYNTNPATGTGQAGGETPFSVAIKGETTIYVSSVRDREVVVIDISTGAPLLVTRIALPGNPNNMIFNNPISQNLLYVAQDNSDQVAVIDTTMNAVVEEIDAIAPPGVLSNPERFTGAAPNALAISPDGQTLYVSQGGANAVAVISLVGPAPHQVAGLIPTGWYPHSLSLSASGRDLYVVNGKSDPGPNPLNLTGDTYALKRTKYPGGNQAAGNAASAANQYVFQVEKAGLLAMPVPGPKDLTNLTSIVAANNFYSKLPNPKDEQMMAALRQRIHHVIYIVKENRTFDQVLGDLTNGANGDPTLAVFGRRITPNFHRLSEKFATLDNFFDSSEVSGNGWEWTTAARETDLNVKQIPLDYASSPTPNAINQGGRAAPYDAEGQNRNVDVGIATLADRLVAEPAYATLAAGLPGGPANLLPGTNNDAEPDGPAFNRQTGRIWDAVLRAGMTVRNYGFLIDLSRYFGVPPAIPLDPHPFTDGVIQAYSTNPSLIPVTDPYFRSFDNNYPDYWREQEWEREFGQYIGGGNLPTLSLVRLMHDHMGSFGTAIAGVNFPEAQQADND